MTSESEYRTIDDVLGNGEERFFASGFKRVGHTLGDGAVEDDGAVKAQAWLTYPRDWSRKSGAAELRPHLSTIDALVIAAALAEVSLIARHGLDAAARGRAWVRSFTMRAGAVPQEELARFGAICRPAVRPTQGGDGYLTTAFDCVVGTIKLRLELAHEGGRPGDLPRAFAALEDVLGPRPGQYLDRVLRRSHTIDDVTVHGAERVTAQTAVWPDLPQPAAAGLGAAHEPSLSVVDCLVCMAQLAQTVVYAIDGVRRGESETLWMRTVWCTADGPDQPMSGPFDAELTVGKSRLLRHDGDLWRTAEVVGPFGPGMRVGSGLAHRLRAAGSSAVGLSDSGPSGSGSSGNGSTGRNGYALADTRGGAR